MEDVTRTKQMIAAEVALARSARHLAETQLAALLGVYYDDREYDRVILEHRRARERAALARQATSGRQPGLPVAA
jgi:hypothetical protein